MLHSLTQGSGDHEDTAGQASSATRRLAYVATNSTLVIFFTLLSGLKGRYQSAQDEILG
ncbi:hypothetical protein [Lacunimicrobium album]